jgi:threonine/homoserine/homoserine lactone efflux protein
VSEASGQRARASRDSELSRVVIACIFSATILGLFAGLAPGPYTTMVAATGLERGFRVAVPMAMAPLVTDLPPMLVSTLVVGRLNWGALTLLGVCGGVVVTMIGLRFLRTHGTILVTTPTGDPIEPAEPSVRVEHVLTSNLLNPAPWVFWFVAAAPLMLAQWNVSLARGVVFVVVLFLVNVSSAAGLAWMAARARGVLSPTNQRRALIGAGLILTCAGAVMVWQALEGNFQSMIDGQRAVSGVLAR